MFFSADCEVLDSMTNLTSSFNTWIPEESTRNHFEGRRFSEPDKVMLCYALPACPSLWSNTNIRTDTGHTLNGACCKEQKSARRNTFKGQILGAVSKPQLPAEKPVNIRLHFCIVLAMLIAVAQWLRCCVTNRKVASSIPAGVGGFFIDIKCFRSHYGPEGRLSL